MFWNATFRPSIFFHPVPCLEGAQIAVHGFTHPCSWQQPCDVGWAEKECPCWCPRSSSKLHGWTGFESMPQHVNHYTTLTPNVLGVLALFAVTYKGKQICKHHSQFAYWNRKILKVHFCLGLTGLVSKSFTATVVPHDMKRLCLEAIRSYR